MTEYKFSAHRKTRRHLH